MDAHGKDDSVTRELRRFELARRLIFHDVRTQTISALTGLSRNRLATLRRRLMVSNGVRRRGPPPRSLELLLRTARGRTEGAALAALLSLFKSRTAIRPLTSLDDGEQLCEIYDAYLAYYPQTNVQFEELMLLNNSLAKEDLVKVGLCRTCRGLMMNHRYDRLRRTCSHCDDRSEHEQVAGLLDQKPKAQSGMTAGATLTHRR